MYTDSYGWFNWCMVVVQDFPCDTKHELETRERHHIEDLHATLNKSIPTRNKKEWYKDNSEKIKASKKEYRHENAEHIKE